jgi:hypothetical protein
VVQKSEATVVQELKGEVLWTDVAYGHGTEVVQQTEATVVLEFKGEVLWIDVAD